MKKYVFWLMTAVLIAFIWGNSLQDATHSSVESRWVLDLVQSTFSVIPGISHVRMYEIRKAAHVTEYMALGFFLSLDLSALNRRGRGMWWHWGASLPALMRRYSFFRLDVAVR